MPPMEQSPEAIAPSAAACIRPAVALRISD